MSSATYLDRSNPTAVLDHVPASPGFVPAVEGRSDFSSPADFAPATSAAAQRAVEAVLTAAEQVGSSDGQAVKLHFSVGGTDLSVRVELRANQVHATFQSDSPELNSAFAHEWREAAAKQEGVAAVLGRDWPSAPSVESGDRPLRLAPAAFSTGGTSSESSSLGSFSGGGSSQERGASARHQEENFAAAVATARTLRSAALPTSGAAAATDSSPSTLSSAPRGTRSSNSPRLSTHA